jgi:hypothetical protein
VPPLTNGWIFNPPLAHSSICEQTPTTLEAADYSATRNLHVGAPARGAHSAADFTELFEKGE